MRLEGLSRTGGALLRSPRERIGAEAVPHRRGIAEEPPAERIAVGGAVWRRRGIAVAPSKFGIKF